MNIFNNNANTNPIAIAQYGNVMIPSKNLSLLRGAGLYNPTPTYEQSTDRGPAYSNALLLSEVDDKRSEDDAYDGSNNKWPTPYSSYDQLNNQPYVIGNELHAQDIGSWSKPTYKQSQGSDRMQQFAMKSTNSVPNPLLNFFFTSDNVQHIQEALKSAVKEIRNIVIGDQNTDKLLTIMLNKYQYAMAGGYLPLSEDNVVYPRGTPDGSPIKDASGNVIGKSAYWNTGSDANTCMSLEYQISKLNQATVEEGLKQILSGIDSYKRYYRQSSSLPMPLDRSVMTSMKGANVLQENLGFYSSHDINKDISSYSQRFNVI